MKTKKNLNKPKKVVSLKRKNNVFGFKKTKRRTSKKTAKRMRGGGGPDRSIVIFDKDIEKMDTLYEYEYKYKDECSRNFLKKYTGQKIKNGENKGKSQPIRLEVTSSGEPTFYVASTGEIPDTSPFKKKCLKKSNKIDEWNKNVLLALESGGYAKFDEEHREKVTNLFIGEPLITKEELDAKPTSHNETGNGSIQSVSRPANKVVVPTRGISAAAPIESETSYSAALQRPQKVKSPMTQRLESEGNRLTGAQQKGYLVSLIRKVLGSEVRGDNETIREWGLSSIEGEFRPRVSITGVNTKYSFDVNNSNFFPWNQLNKMFKSFRAFRHLDDKEGRFPLQVQNYKYILEKGKIIPRLSIQVTGYIPHIKGLHIKEIKNKKTDYKTQISEINIKPDMLVDIFRKLLKHKVLKLLFENEDLLETYQFEISDFINESDELIFLKGQEELDVNLIKKMLNFIAHNSILTTFNLNRPHSTTLIFKPGYFQFDKMYDNNYIFRNIERINNDEYSHIGIIKKPYIGSCEKLRTSTHDGLNLSFITKSYSWNALKENQNVFNITAKKGKGDFTKKAKEKLITFNKDEKCQLILKIYCNIRPTSSYQELSKTYKSFIIAIIDKYFDSLDLIKTEESMGTSKFKNINLVNEILKKRKKEEEKTILIEDLKYKLNRLISGEEKPPEGQIIDRELCINVKKQLNNLDKNTHVNTLLNLKDKLEKPYVPKKIAEITNENKNWGENENNKWGEYTNSKTGERVRI